MAEDQPQLEAPTADQPKQKGNISGFLFLAAFAMLTSATSYALSLIWPGENASLSYLPRFLSSCIIAFLICSLLGMKPRS
jgi:hypothetical protein